MPRLACKQQAQEEPEYKKQPCRAGMQLLPSVWIALGLPPAPRKTPTQFLYCKNFKERAGQNGFAILCDFPCCIIYSPFCWTSEEHSFKKIYYYSLVTYLHPKCCPLQFSLVLKEGSLWKNISMVTDEACISLFLGHSQKQKLPNGSRLGFVG